MSETLPAHSPVGGSAAHTFLACPLSVSGAQGITDHDEAEEPGFTRDGTAAHEVIEHCLTYGVAAWQRIGGSAKDGWPITRKIADGAQVFVDCIRSHHPARPKDCSGIEQRFHCPSIHPLFFSAVDFWILQKELRQLDIWDYKNGAGVVVEIEDNEQLQYYGCGIMEKFDLWDSVDRVVLHIVQPNAYHPDGRHRQWVTTPDRLYQWLHGVLVPGIERALTSRDSECGEHCRFCPLRARACPAILKAMEELQAMIDQIEKAGGSVDALSNAEVGRFLSLFEVAKIQNTAMLKTGYHRANAGNSVAGWKLVRAKANREWKDGADLAAMKTFSDQALTDPKLKSPAQIDELPLGTQFTAEWAQSPDRGLTLAPAKDKRMEVSRDTRSLFEPVKPVEAPVTQPSDTPPPRRRTARAQ